MFKNLNKLSLQAGVLVNSKLGPGTPYIPFFRKTLNHLNIPFFDACCSGGLDNLPVRFSNGDIQYFDGNAGQWASLLVAPETDSRLDNPHMGEGLTANILYFDLKEGATITPDFLNVELPVMVGVRNVNHPRLVTATTDDLLETDDCVVYDNVATITLTVPPGLPVGHNSLHTPINTGMVKIIGGFGVTIYNVDGHNGSFGQYSSVGLYSIAPDTYILCGDTDIVV